MGAGQDRMGVDDGLRLDARRGAESHERRLVLHEEIDEAGKEAGVVHRVADLAGGDARQRQETRQELRLAGQPAEDGKGRCIRVFTRGCFFLAFHSFPSGNLPFHQPSDANVAAVGLGDFGFAATYLSPGRLQGRREEQGRTMPKQVMIVEDNELNMKLFRDLI